jgi:hypothetical protein
MKKTIILLSLLTAGVFISSYVSAQSFTSLQYTVGIPFGGLKDHTNKVSGRGFTFEFHKEVAPALSVGVNVGYSVFYEHKPYGSYTRNNATLTGIQYRYNNVFPMLVNAHYAFGEGMIVPYIGLGLGTVYDLRNTNMGLYTIEENNWHFLISPEAGLLFDVSAGTSIKLNVKYDNAVKTQEADGFGNLNICLGFVFNSW